MAHFAVWSPSENERENILTQHKELYNGYQTLNHAAMEKIQPLYTQDFANDKSGLTVNNRGEVMKYTNMGINESVSKEMCEQYQHVPKMIGYKYVDHNYCSTCATWFRRIEFNKFCPCCGVPLRHRAKYTGARYEDIKEVLV